MILALGVPLSGFIIKQLTPTPSIRTLPPVSLEGSDPNAIKEEKTDTANKKTSNNGPSSVGQNPTHSENPNKTDHTIRLQVDEPTEQVDSETRARPDPDKKPGNIELDNYISSIKERHRMGYLPQAKAEAEKALEHFPGEPRLEALYENISEDMAKKTKND